MDKWEVQDKIVNMLPQISFFGGADEEEVDQIMEYVDEVEAEAGSYIYREGDPPGDLYILLEGRMEFSILEERVAEGEPGILFGMTATIGIQKQLASALAKTDVKLAVISKRLFMTMCKKNPELFGKVILNVARDMARDLKFLREYVKEHKRCPR